MRPSLVSSVLVTALVMATGATPAGAQSLGTFRWQLQPFCNRLTVTVTQTGTGYTLDGTDDLCGAAPRAAANGLAFQNPNGTITFGLTLVVPPGPTPLHVTATIDLASLGGSWSDSAGNTGVFVFNPAAATGSPRPAVRPTFTAGLSAGGGTITNLAAPVNASDAATKAYVDGTVAGASSGVTFITAGHGGWEPFVSTDDLTFTRNSNDLRVSKATPGRNYLTLHPSLPTAMNGKALRLLGVEICYRASANVFLTAVIVGTTAHPTSPGSSVIHVLDLTDRTDQACRNYALATPHLLSRQDAVNVYLDVNWNAASSVFLIGRTTFVLDTSSTPVVAP